MQVPRVLALGRATRAWATVRRERVDPGGSELILIELAVGTSDMADRARVEKDFAKFLRAGSQLRQLIMAVDRDRGSASSDGGTSSSDGTDDWSDELAELLGAGAEMGDAQDT